MSFDTIGYSEWSDILKERLTKFMRAGVAPVFEVGASQKLLVFELGGTDIGAEELQTLINDAELGLESDTVIHNVKPGLWSLSVSEEETPYIATWVSDDHIDYDALPQAPVVSPLNLDGVEWQQAQDITYDSTHGCIVALEIAQEYPKDELAEVIEEFQDLGLEGFRGEIQPGGFTFWTHEHVPFSLYLRIQNGQVVQLKLCGPDEEDGGD